MDNDNYWVLSYKNKQLLFILIRQNQSIRTTVDVDIANVFVEPSHFYTGNKRVIVLNVCAIDGSNMSNRLYKFSVV